MVAYKDILNTFGGDTSYADRYQAAMLKGDMNALSSIANEYKASQGGTTESSNTPTGYTPQTTYTPSTPITPTTGTTYNQGNNLGNWNYGDTSADRQDEIVSNLNQAYAQNPNQFSDWATFAQNFNYDYSGRSDKERETMRNWYQQNVGNQMDYNNANNTDYFLGQLMSGQTLGGTGAAATAAMNRYRNLQSLSSMTPDQIVSAIQSGSLNGVGQEMQDLKNYSPALYAQVQTAMQNQTAVGDINSMGMGIYDGLTKTTSNSNYTKYNFTDEYAKNASVIKQYNESLYKKIEGLGGDTAAYVSIVASMLQNPLIQANKDEIENIEGEIRKIQENIYTVGDTARERLGSEAPEDLVSAYISQQTKQLQNQLRTAQNSLLVAQGKLDNQLAEVETLIDAINQGIKLQQYNDKMALAGMPTSTTTTTSYSGGGGGGGGGYTQPTQTDTNDYQDDSDARLKEISNNLNSLYKSNPELFKDRATFDNYFKYNQRSPRQKMVLDAFFIQKKGLAASALGKARVGGVQTQQEEDDLIRAIKKDLLSGKVVSFGDSAMKKEYGKYGVVGRGQDASHNAIQQMGKISTLSEIDVLMEHLDSTLDSALLEGYWSANTNKIISGIKSKGDGNTKNERNAIAEYLSQYSDYLTADQLKSKFTSWLKSAGVNDSNITTILKQFGITSTK